MHIRLPSELWTCAGLVPCAPGHSEAFFGSWLFNYHSRLKSYDEKSTLGHTSVDQALVWLFCEDVCSSIDGRIEDSEHLMFRLGGLEKRKQRKEYLQEVRNTKAKDGYL
ncbi:hypothetical protein Tco_1013558 [Tanacetum coccineum]